MVVASKMKDGGVKKTTLTKYATSDIGACEAVTDLRDDEMIVDVWEDLSAADVEEIKLDHLIGDADDALRCEADDEDDPF